MGVYGHTHRLFGHLNARLLAQVLRQSLRGPVGGLLSDVMGVSLDDSQQCCFPGCGDCPLPTRSGAPGNGIQSIAQEALEHTHHGLLATEHELGDLA